MKASAKTLDRRFILRACMLLFSSAIALCSLNALSHHGWTWAEEEQSTLKGTIQEISMAPPHPTLRVKAEDGVLWQVDLGNPSQTQRSGFTGDTAKAGDAITVLGNRSKEPGKAHMKAVRITIGGKNYDLYPERLTQH
jgi:hypothetical protein